LPGWSPDLTPDTARRAAALILLYPGIDGPSLALTVRRADLPHHPGQVSLPGGALDPGESPLAAALRERAHAAALGVPRVREVHNLTVLDVAGTAEISLHLKLPGDLSLAEAHSVAESVERAILAAVPEAADVHTHIEPIVEEGVGEEVEADAATVEGIVLEATGSPPRALRFLHTDAGLVAYLTLAMESSDSLASVHEQASVIEQRIHDAVPEIADVVVHTEPGPQGHVRDADQWSGSGGGRGAA